MGIPPLISWTDKTHHTQAARLQGKALSCLNRGLEAETLNQPVLVVERAKLFRSSSVRRYAENRF